MDDRTGSTTDQPGGGAGVPDQPAGRAEVVAAELGQVPLDPDVDDSDLSPEANDDGGGDGDEEVDVDVEVDDWLADDQLEVSSVRLRVLKPFWHSLQAF